MITNGLTSLSRTETGVRQESGSIYSLGRELDALGPPAGAAKAALESYARDVADDEWRRLAAAPSTLSPLAQADLDRLWRDLRSLQRGLDASDPARGDLTHYAERIETLRQTRLADSDQQHSRHLLDYPAGLCRRDLVPRRAGGVEALRRPGEPDPHGGDRAGRRPCHRPRQSVSRPDQHRRVHYRDRAGPVTDGRPRRDPLRERRSARSMGAGDQKLFCKTASTGKRAARREDAMSDDTQEFAGRTVLVTGAPGGSAARPRNCSPAAARPSWRSAVRPRTSRPSRPRPDAGPSPSISPTSTRPAPRRSGACRSTCWSIAQG